MSAKWPRRLESRRLSDFARPEFARAPITQCLVWALFLVPPDPRCQLTPRVVEAGEVVLPDTFLLQAAEEARESASMSRARAEVAQGE